jgi:pimeloyl-ACP methyl ester carboxylesterase
MINFCTITIAVLYWFGAASYFLLSGYTEIHVKKLLLYGYNFPWIGYIAILSPFLALAALAFYIGFKIARKRALSFHRLITAALLGGILAACPWLWMLSLQLKYAKGEPDLAKLSRLYHNQAEWEQRARLIRSGLLSEADLVPLPRRTPLKPRIDRRRDYGEYSVETVVFESVPGFFVAGNLYRAFDNLSPKPVVLIPHGHFKLNRFEEHNQQLGATLARMGAIAMTLDMVGRGENTHMRHHVRQVMKYQLWNNMRAVDFLLSLEGADPGRVAVIGASGGGTQAFLLGAVDPRISVVAAASIVSSFAYGGCHCESGMPIHKGPGYATNNVEISGLIAPRPLLLVSDGQDSTRFTPESEYPFLRRIYRFFGQADKVENAHFAQQGHDYSPAKREATYRFLAKHLALDIQPVLSAQGAVDESRNVVENMATMRAYTKTTPLPSYALRGEAAVGRAFRELQQPGNPATALESRFAPP